MKTIIQTDPSNPRALEWTGAPEPALGNGQALVKVKAAGVNHANLLQAAGHYPPPKGVTDTLGLECMGVIEEVKGDSQGWRIDDEVYCLLSGSAYAEKVAVPAGQILPLSRGYSFTEAASIAEVACTVFSNAVVIAGLKEGDLLLIHDGAGGIGTFAIQMAKRLDARVAVTASSAEKLAKCKELGANILISYKEEDFAEIVTAGGGVNVILDTMGAKYLDRNVKALAKDGHLVIVGMQDDVKDKLNIGRLLGRRSSITATGLHCHDPAGKAHIVSVTEDIIWPMLADDAVTPQIHEAMNIHDAAKAHKLLDSGAVSDKIVLTV